MTGELERWGFKWRGHDHGTHERMADGYWTPWHIANDMIERQAAEIARLREALTVIRGSGKAGTWSAVTEPLVGRFDVASKFRGDAVHNAEGSMAMAGLLRAMASKLDNACVAARQALGDHNG